MSQSDEAKALHAHIADFRAGMRARLAAWQDDVDMLPTNTSISRHPGVAARFDINGELVDLRIDSNALAEYAHIQLQDIIANVLNTARERLLVRGNTLMQFMDCRMDEIMRRLAEVVGVQASQRERKKAATHQLRTYAESSRDGTVALALDQGEVVLWCRLESEVSQWPAAVLADRIRRLYTLASMRVCVDLRRRSEEQVGPELAAEIFSKPAAASFPDKAALKRYRRDHIDF